MFRRIKKRWAISGIAVCILLAVIASKPAYFSGQSYTHSALSPTLITEQQKGIGYFAFGDWGSLTSDALQVSASPWKLSLAVLALQQVEGNLDNLLQFDAATAFRQFGFHSPTSMGNWPASLPEPQWNAPLGQNVGIARGKLLPTAVTIGNIGCAACHSSVMFNSDGSPDINRVWLGMPNGSINLEAYTNTLFEAVRDYGQTDMMMAAVDALFPETQWQERLTLRYFVLPEFQRVVQQRDAEFGQLLPFRASLAGATNGLDSLKRRLDLIPPGTVLTDSIFNSIPDLGGRLWRTKLLNTGSYAIPDINHQAVMQLSDIDKKHRTGLAGIIAFFTVPSMGVSLDVAEAHIDNATDVTSWMQSYTPQTYPGEINRDLAVVGRSIYANSCAECHGSYTEDTDAPKLISFPNWEGNVNTDKRRAELLTQEVADAVNGDKFGRYINTRTVSGYTAPPLTGVWASAPYLHNGSVPTLWHLMRPAQRPDRFQVGGHHLDLQAVGIAGVDDGHGGWWPKEKPWSIPAQVDTSLFGLSNVGHEAPFDGMNDEGKQALLEYLKLL